MAGPAAEIVGSDGTKWRIRYSLEALAWFERQTGIKLAKVEGIDPGEMYLDEMAALFAAGIYHENRDVTVSDGFQMLESLSNDQAAELLETFARDQGFELPADEDREDTKKPAKKKSGRGKGSNKSQ